MLKLKLPHGIFTREKGMEYGVDYGLSQCHGFESESIPSWSSDSMWLVTYGIVLIIGIDKMGSVPCGQARSTATTEEWLLLVPCCDHHLKIVSAALGRTGGHDLKSQADMLRSTAAGDQMSRGEIERQNYRLGLDDPWLHVSHTRYWGMQSHACSGEGLLHIMVCSFQLEYSGWYVMWVGAWHQLHNRPILPTCYEEVFLST